MPALVEDQKVATTTTKMKVTFLQFKIRYDRTFDLLVVTVTLMVTCLDYFCFVFLAVLEN